MDFGRPWGAGKRLWFMNVGRRRLKHLIIFIHNEIFATIAVVK